MTLDDYRRFYAEEIEQVASLNSPALVEAFARVPREAARRILRVPYAGYVSEHQPTICEDIP
jgi:hypothetical protein